MLYIIPIEPLEERYSAQWLKWTLQYFGTIQAKCYKIIAPEVPGYTSIQRGAFLDVVETNRYKNLQMTYILDAAHRGDIKDGDVFWFHDMWFPGLEMLAYIRNGLGLNIKIYGMLHAGTYDPHDFLTKKGMGAWAEPLEESWFRLVDGIFVATNFHKDLLVHKRPGFDHSKIHVTGFPLYQEPKFWYQPDPKEKMVVFPHRLDDEKQPNLFDDLEVDMKMKYAWVHDWQFIKTKLSYKTKDQYYRELIRAKYAVSFALQETWGIAMQEAVLCGCIPIVPNRLSYYEMYPDIFKYDEKDNVSEVLAAATLIDKIENHTDTEHIRDVMEHLQSNIIHNGSYAFPNMLKIMDVI